MRASLANLVVPAAFLLLGACTHSPMAPPARYAELNCGSAMARNDPDPGPYRPGVLCLAYQGLPETTGARSGAGTAPMKAISVDGRVYFVSADRDGPPPGLR